MHIQYPDGKKAEDPKLDSNGGALAGYYDDRKDVASAGERGFV